MILQEYLDKGQPLTLRNCQIFVNKRTGKPQVVIKSFTAIEKAKDTTCTITTPDILGSPRLHIDQLYTLNDYDRMTLEIKAIQVSGTITVPTGKTKQDVIVAEQTGSTTITLWEDDINSLTEGTCYKLNRIQVHTFLATKQLTFPSFGASIQQINALPNIDFQPPSVEEDTQLFNASIVVINRLETVTSCIHCKKPLNQSP